MTKATFGRRSVLRRVAGEAVLILDGQRALLMQVAHPKVAAGVAHHSGFRRPRCNGSGRRSTR